MKTISVVGLGFVGHSLAVGMQHAYDVLTYDKYVEERSTEPSLDALIEKTENVIFVSVPTPMKETGQCDISIVEGVVSEINQICFDANRYKDEVDDSGVTVKPDITVVIKSTVPPGTTKHLDMKYKFVNVAFNPEFLTEANAIEDFKNQSRIVLGFGEDRDKAQNSDALLVLEKTYKKAYPKVPILKTSSSAAEMVKYVTNCFLATKVSFANEIYEFCQMANIDYDSMIEIAKHDDRLGQSHWKVPGPMPDPQGNLKPGFSGSCFVKDINALMFLLKQMNVNPSVMEGAWKKNLEVRPERDWEQLVGRAVVAKKENKSQ